MKISDFYEVSCYTALGTASLLSFAVASFKTITFVMEHFKRMPYEGALGPYFWMTTVAIVSMNGFCFLASCCIMKLGRIYAEAKAKDLYSRHFTQVTPGTENA